MDKVYLIYAYEDPTNKVVYVGLTCNIKNRDRAHRKPEHKTGEYDTVARYFKSIGKELPQPRIKMTDLNGAEAGYYEDWYKNAYANNGWITLNKGKTGEGISSLGGGIKIWDYEKCYALALTCKMKHEMGEKSSQALLTARENGWLKDYVWFEKPRRDMGYWTHETCYEAALDCQTKQELLDKYPTAYNLAWSNGWLDEYDWFVSGKLIWTKEKCYEVAKKCNTRTQMSNEYSPAYNQARINGWLDEYDWLLDEKEARKIGNKKQWENRTIHIKQYGLEGNFIKEWNSATDAAKFINKKPNNITSCCSGNKKTAYGFIWKYA